MIDRVLIIDDNTGLLELSKEVLEGHNYNVLIADNGISGIALFESCYVTVSCVICDIDLPDITGFEVVKKLRSIDSKVPILIWSGNDDKLALMQQNGYHTLPKPFRVHVFVNAVESIKRETFLP